MKVNLPNVDDGVDLIALSRAVRESNRQVEQALQRVRIDTLRSGGTTGQVLARDLTQGDGLVWTPYATSAYNAVIGGDFSTNPWQRGASFAAVADSTFTADRFLYVKNGAMVHDISKSANAPTVTQCGRLVTHCMLVDCTTVDAAIAAGEYALIMHNIEGRNFIPLAQDAMAFQFWHAHTKTGTYCVSFGNSVPDRSYIIEYAQAVADAWELCTAIIPASPSAGTWDYVSGIGLRVRWALAAGSTFLSAANSWLTGNFFTTANQVNACDSTANNFRIALVDLRPGSIVLPAQSRDGDEEAHKSRRYFRKSYDIGDAPGTSTEVNADFSVAINTVDFYDFGGHELRGDPMRTTSTIVLYSTTGASGKVRDLTALADRAASANGGASSYRVAISGTGVASNAHGWHWTASAEL